MCQPLSGADGHVDVAGALNGRGEKDVAVARQEGQGKEQSRDELGADVARDVVNAALQPAADAQGQAALGDAGHALFGQGVGIDPDRALGQPAASGEHGVNAACRRNGNKEPQRAAALTAVQHSGSVFKHTGAVHGQHVAVQTDGRAQRLGTADGRPNVLGQCHGRNGTHTAGECRADDRTVHVAFGRRRLDGSRRGKGLKGHIAHIILPKKYSAQSCR